ncbi:MAG: ribosome silencing factor [Lachnospiraceae bacterium]|nr:ribosome silencing factor [Lachnospiraceae bacterium]
MEKMEEILKLITDKLAEKKAEDISVIDISEMSIMADYFVIASGSNINQIHAMADFVQEELAKKDIKPKHIEGYNSGNWILMDYSDIIIHIFDKESRSFYDLDHIWKGGKVLTLS